MSELPFPVPEKVRHNIVLYFGEKGRRWLEALPELLAKLSTRFQLKLGEPFSNLSINMVIPATRSDGTEVVLKVGVPNKELLTEIESLRLFEGRKAVRLLDADIENGALLLERISPGTSLLKFNDDEQATAIAADVLMGLQADIPAEHSFPSLQDWFQSFPRVRARYEGRSGPLRQDLFDMAEQLSRELLQSISHISLLHGDLHHDNIVCSGSTDWLAIDPKGVIGEREFEVAPFLRNPMPALLETVSTAKVLARRIDQFAELTGFDRQRLIRWGLTESILSATWDLDDTTERWQREVTIAQIFAKML